MKFRNHEKLLRIGFTIIRPDYKRRMIMAKTPDNWEWHLLQNHFKSRKEMHQAMENLLDRYDVVED